MESKKSTDVTKLNNTPVIYICNKHGILYIQCKLRAENRFTYVMGKTISFPGITRKMHFRYHNIGNKTFFKQSGL